MSIHTLYGSPLSLYSGKARSYLIKNGLPYREMMPATRHYAETVRPAAKMLMMPTVETADGIVLRDGAAIVEHFESASGHPCQPTTSCQRILSRLIDVIGMEGLLRPAMHYRWSFDAENEAFLLHHFGAMAPPGVDGKAVAAKNMGRMRGAAVAFGVVPEGMAGIERRYDRFLMTLDRHFAEMPYLLGHRPSIGDFSLIAPMYGHLGRDPKPLSIMQAKAMNVFRWVERMNRPELDQGEFITEEGDVPSVDFLSDDAIAETLIDVLSEIAVDFVPETIAAADFINEWLDGENRPAKGTALERGVGMTAFETDGETVNALAQPYRFYLLARVQADYDTLNDSDRERVDVVLDATGLAPVLNARLTREIGREDNLEIWL
ncbi:MAG: glutathione S-transferase family protein [Myxococcota bacterium]